jgi:hypothetical protein
MRAVAVVFACCIGCSTGLPIAATSPDAGDGLGGNGDGGARLDLAGGDLGGRHDLGGDMASGNAPGAPPLHLIVQSAPTAIASGSSFNLSFEVLDAANAPVTISRPVFITLGVHPAGAVLSGLTTVVATNGVATFNLSVDHWGAYTLVATTPDAPPAETPVLNVKGSQLRWLTQPTTAVAHQPMAPSVRVGVVDVTGAVDTTATGQVNLWTSLSPCSGYLVGGTSAVISAGVATFDDVAFDKACSGYLLQATGIFPVNSQVIVSDPFDVVPGAPALLALEVALTHTPASRDLPFDLTAHVEDAGGNEVPTTTTVTLSVSPATPLGGPTSVMTGGTTATFAGVSVGVAGDFVFEASAPGLQPGYASLTVTPWQWRGTNTAALLVDPTNPDVVWIDGSPWLYAGQLARSSDRGATWTAIGALPNDGPKLAIDPLVPTTMYGSSGYETWKSTDGGQTTSNLPLTGGPLALTIDPSSSSRLYAVSATNVWKSVDFGASWSAITPAIASNMTALTVDPTNSAVVYLSGANIWRSTDGGATWSAAGGLPAPSSDGFSRVAVNPATPSRVVACDSSGCYRSVDGGANFAQVYSGYVGYGSIAVAFDPATPTAVYACGNYGLAASSDGGASFALVPLYPGTVYSCALAPSSPSTIYITNGDGTWVTTNGGR